MPDEPGAVWIPTNNYMSRNGYTPKWIILHGTAGFTNARDVGVYFQHADVSAHYVIGPDGTIVQCVDEKWAAWANGPIENGADSWWRTYGNGNYPTISIEHVKPHTDNSDELTPAQKAASFRLVAHICERHGIRRAKATADGGITGHFSTDPVNRSRCPGPYPWDELFSYLTNGGEDMAEVQIGKGIGAHFKDAGGGIWKCDNGFVLGGRIRSYWAHYEGILGLPKSNEIGIGKDGSTLQLFERGILVYDPNYAHDKPPRQPGTNAPDKVYPMHLDSGDGQARIAKPLVDSLNKTVAALTAQVASLQQQLASTQNANIEQLQAQIQDLTTQLTGAKSALAQIQSLAASAASK